MPVAAKTRNTESKNLRLINICYDYQIVVSVVWPTKSLVHSKFATYRFDSGQTKPLNFCWFFIFYFFMCCEKCIKIRSRPFIKPWAIWFYSTYLVLIIWKVCIRSTAIMNNIKKNTITFYTCFNWHKSLPVSCRSATFDGLFLIFISGRSFQWKALYLMVMLILYGKIMAAYLYRGTNPGLNKYSKQKTALNI